MQIAEYIGIGGPVGIGAAILGFLLNAWLTKRRDDREEIKIERESETGIVETTKQALAMARDEMVAMNAQRLDERKEHIARIEAIRTEKNEEITRLRERIEALIRENQELLRENLQMRGFR
jgi:hypothetical protein